MKIAVRGIYEQGVFIPIAVGAIITTSLYNGVGSSQILIIGYSGTAVSCVAPDDAVRECKRRTTVSKEITVYYYATYIGTDLRKAAVDQHRRRIIVNHSTPNGSTTIAKKAAVGESCRRTSGVHPSPVIAIIVGKAAIGERSRRRVFAKHSSTVTKITQRIIF